jgi:uncharacterized protein
MTNESPTSEGSIDIVSAPTPDRTPRYLPGFHVLAKPVGPICNLDCRYCFYLHKENFFPKGEKFQMSDETLENFVRQYIESQQVPEINFAWQGGEPTLLGVKFFRKVIELQKKYAQPGKTVSNAFQTNGVLLDDEWCEFLKEHDFLIGLSIDGPREMHDKYRVDKGGKPTFDRVMAGLRVLQKHGVRVNSLTCVNRVTGNHGGDVYRFLRDDAGLEHMQFIPIVEERTYEEQAPGVRTGDAAGQDPLRIVTPWTVEPKQFGRFLCGVFDEWVRHDVGKIFVQHFEVSLALVMGLPSPLCIFSKTCGKATAIEHDGMLYSCDHFVYDPFKLGNVNREHLRDMLVSKSQIKFGVDKFSKLPRYCRQCEYLTLCYGECPKNRILKTPDGEPGLNYLCAGLKIFFAHVTPVLGMMAQELRAGRPAVGVMHALQAAEQAEDKGKPLQPQRPPETARPNDPCPCGSGKKFKKCCGRK